MDMADKTTMTRGVIKLGTLRLYGKAKRKIGDITTAGDVKFQSVVAKK